MHRLPRYIHPGDAITPQSGLTHGAMLFSHIGISTEPSRIVAHVYEHDVAMAVAIVDHVDQRERLLVLHNGRLGWCFPTAFKRVK